MTHWSGKSVLVTGATGMVGSWLVKRLIAENAHVSTLVVDHDPQSELIRSGDIKKTTVFNGDLRDAGEVIHAVVGSECEYIFHLGAQTIVGHALKNPRFTFESNIAGTWNIYEALRSSGLGDVPVLIASSDKAYGTSITLPYDEKTPLAGEGPYDVSKSCTDLIARSYFLSYGIPTVIARCGNIYGGGDLNWSRIVPGTIRDLLAGNRPVIRSNGKFLRDYVYVEDAVDAYLEMAIQVHEKDVNGEAFNFSREEPLSVLDIYRAVCSATTGEYIDPIIEDRAKNEIVDQHLSSTKATSILGWNSKFDLETGLNLTVEWYRKHLGVKNV